MWRGGLWEERRQMSVCVPLNTNTNNNNKSDKMMKKEMDKSVSSGISKALN